MTESFYVNDKNCDDDIQDEGVSLNCDDATNNVMTFLDDSFNKVLLNMINIEVETALNIKLDKLLKDSNGQNIIKVTESKEDSNDEIVFLRRELENKSEIMVTEGNGTSVLPNVESNI